MYILDICQLRYLLFQLKMCYSDQERPKGLMQLLPSPIAFHGKMLNTDASAIIYELSRLTCLRKGERHPECSTLLLFNSVVLFLDLSFVQSPFCSVAFRLIL